MFSSVGKTSAFLVLLSALTICSSAVCAQNKPPEQTVSAESLIDFSSLENELKSNSSVENDFSDKAVYLPNVFQKNDGKKYFYRSDDETETFENAGERLNSARESKSDDFAYHFRTANAPPRKLDFEVAPNRETKHSFERPAATDSRLPADSKKTESTDNSDNVEPTGFQWRAAIGQSLLFLAVQHGYAFTQPKTREALKGKFWKDYAQSVKNLRGWDDGGRFFTNYIAHPMQGSMTGFIYVQNDPKARKQEFGTSGDYWRGRMKAMLWTAAWSTQFEIGPLSQASIGNVGLKGKQTWEDIVNTPTLGTAMLIGEDAIDRFVMQRIERGTDNFYVKIFSRMLLSPTRVFANLLRFKAPWHRDRPPAR